MARENGRRVAREVGQELGQAFRSAKKFVKKHGRVPRSRKGQPPLAFAVTPQEERELSVGEMITGFRIKSPYERRR